MKLIYRLSNPSDLPCRFTWHSCLPWYLGVSGDKLKKVCDALSVAQGVYIGFILDQTDDGCFAARVLYSTVVLFSITLAETVTELNVSWHKGVISLIIWFLILCFWLSLHRFIFKCFSIYELPRTRIDTQQAQRRYAAMQMPTEIEKFTKYGVYHLSRGLNELIPALTFEEVLYLLRELENEFKQSSSSYGSLIHCVEEFVNSLEQGNSERCENVVQQMCFRESADLLRAFQNILSQKLVEHKHLLKQEQQERHQEDVPDAEQASADQHAPTAS